MLNDRIISASPLSAQRCICVLMLVVLSGCALIKDDDISQIAPISSDQVRLSDDIHLARDGWPSALWWKSYGDVQLDRLINQALNNSPSMDIARSKVEQAQAKVELVRSGMALQVTASASINQMRVSDAGGLGPLSNSVPDTGIDGPWYTAGTLGALATYPIDIWGKQRQQVSAAIGIENAQLAELAAVELQLSTDVAQLYYGIQTSLHTVDLLLQALEILDITVEGRAARLARGIDNVTPIEQARAQQLNIESQLISAESRVVELREGLRALVGANAFNLPTITKVPLPSNQAELPATLSYELLVRRPDLQVMRWYVLASVADINSAQAAFYPSLDIKSFLGFQSLNLDDLFRNRSIQFNIIPGVSLPIFDGGRLNANLTGAKAANNLAVAQYNQSVLNAVRDVAVAASRIEAYDAQAQLQIKKLKAETVTDLSTEAKFQRGLVNRLTALNARLPVIAEEVSLVGILGQQLTQSITLVKALGGGYQAEIDNSAKGSGNASGNVSEDNDEDEVQNKDLKERKYLEGPQDPDIESLEYIEKQEKSETLESPEYSL